MASGRLTLSISFSFFSFLFLRPRVHFSLLLSFFLLLLLLLFRFTMATIEEPPKLSLNLTKSFPLLPSSSYFPIKVRKGLLVMEIE